VSLRTPGARPLPFPSPAGRHRLPKQVRWAAGIALTGFETGAPAALLSDKSNHVKMHREGLDISAPNLYGGSG